MSHPRSRRRAKADEEATTSDLRFEDAFAQMQEVIALLERGDVPLDEAVSAFERGMRLARHCNDALDAATLRVQALESVREGSYTTIDIEVDTE